MERNNQTEKIFWCCRLKHTKSMGEKQINIFPSLLELRAALLQCSVTERTFVVAFFS